MRQLREIVAYTIILMGSRICATISISKRFGATRRTGVRIRNPVGREDEQCNEDHFVALINQLFRFALRGRAGTHEDLGNLIART